MTDESRDESTEDEAERDDERVESAELGEDDLEKASGGVNPTKNLNSPFDP